jgi:hypothetical protein
MILWNAVNLVKYRFMVATIETDSSVCEVVCTCRAMVVIGWLRKGMHLTFQGFTLNLV